MSKKRNLAIILLGVGAGLALGSKKASADEPPPDPNEPLDPIGPVVFDPPPEPPEPPLDPIGPVVLTTGALEIWTSLVRPTPTLNAGYQLKPGENLYGNGGVIDRALKSAGMSSTGSARRAYYVAAGRVRSTVRLYATSASHLIASHVERYTVQQADGSTVAATWSPATCPWHDRWPQAMQAGEKPNRLIAWSRQNPVGPCGGLLATGGWQQLLHGVGRTFGCVWLPDASAIDAGLDVTANDAFDWPPELWSALGISRMEL